MARSSFTWTEVEGPPAASPTCRYALVSLQNGARVLVRADPSVTRCELALTTRCGSLDDPRSLEGLAHLAEHVTIATDPAGLSPFLRDRKGEINAFTADRTTNFYCQFDEGRKSIEG